MPANSSLAIEVQRLHPREVIRASAGTGKTYQLSSRYIAQLKRVAPDRILATTFTRKAAGEILERVLQRLAEACRDPHRRSELAASIGETELARQQCEELLSGLTSQLHRIRVGTLDSFFSRVAGAFSLELGLPPGWRLLDDLEDEQLRGRAIETVLREGDARDLTQLIHLLDKGRAGRGVTRLVRDTIDDLYDVYLDTDEHAW
ncbi:MAG: helicase, partial [Planctomycetota bacterium]